MSLRKFGEGLALILFVALVIIFIEVKFNEAVSAEEPQPAVKVKKWHPPESIPGEYLVRLKNKSVMTGQNIKALEEKLRAKVLRTYRDLDFIVVQKPVIQNHLSASSDLLASGEALIVEPNYIYRANKLPKDPSFGNLWGMKNTGQTAGTLATSPAGVSGIDIDAERAWDLSTDSGQAVVAVIDTGIDYNHPDLQDNIWVNTAEANGTAGVDDDANGLIDDIHGANFSDAKTQTGEPLDDNGHGTHCAGTIGGRGDNGEGVAGVNWKTKMMAVKFLDSGGGGSLENAMRAVDYATKMGAKILSNSWSGGGFSQFLQEAIVRANQAGVLFVAAASNYGDDNDINPTYPGSYPVPNVVSVAALDNRGRLAEFSNYGKKTVHLAAPGKDVFSTWKGGGYQYLSGTSMATPHVSGVAALLWGREPTLGHLDVKARVLAGVRPLGVLRKKTISGGMLSAYYTLSQEAAPVDPDDPSHWQRKAMSFSTPHPYAKKAEIIFEVSVPGAREIAVFFDKMEIESFYDFVFFLDRNGKTLATSSETYDAGFSPTILGDYVKIVLRSDDSVEKYGFDLSGVAYR